MPEPTYLQKEQPKYQNQDNSSNVKIDDIELLKKKAAAQAAKKEQEKREFAEKIKVLMSDTAKKATPFKKEILGKHKQRLIGIIIMPPKADKKLETKAGKLNDKLDILCLLEFKDISDIKKKIEKKQEIEKKIKDLAKKKLPGHDVNVVLLDEIWDMCLKGKHDILNILSIGMPLYDSGWIGALRISDANKYGRGKDTWKWLDGTEWNWTNFQPGEPNNWGNGEGGLHTYWNGNWNDISVDRRLPGIYKIYNKSIDMNKAVSVAQKHWKMYGCTVRENKTYACAKPPNTVGNFKYEGCYNDNYHTRAVPNYGGVVKNLGECSKIAEKKREAVFGVKDGYNCYTSNDLINAKKYDTATGCSTMGKKLGYQIYNRHPPYPPINKNLTKNDFSNSIEHFENEYKFNNKYSLLIIIILLIILIYYFNV